jgi:hypothetical protein
MEISLTTSLFEYLPFIFSMYLTTMLAINWHRAFLNDPYDFPKANIFTPTKSEFKFILLALLAVVFLTEGFRIIDALTPYTSWTNSIAGIVFIIVFLWLLLRTSFYLPAKALDHELTLKEAFSLSKGYVWKILATFSIASIKMVIISLVIAVIAYINIDMHTNITTFGDYEPNIHSAEYIELQKTYETKFLEIAETNDYEPDLNPEDYATPEEYEEAWIEDMQAVLTEKAMQNPEIQAIIQELAITASNDMFAQTTLLIMVIMGIVLMYAIPISVAIWVATLSNFYQHALSNKEAHNP